MIDPSPTSPHRPIRIARSAAPSPRSALDWSAEEFQRVLARLAESLMDALERTPLEPVIPITSARDLRALFVENLPEEPTPNEEMLSLFEGAIIANAAKSFGSRFNTYIMQCGTMQGVAADLVASFLNQNACKWHLAPVSAELETLSVRWLIEFLGLPPVYGGALVSGASVATLIALATMRARMAPEVGRKGLYEVDPIRIYGSDQTHSCIRRALRLLGLGDESLFEIRSTDRFTLDVAALQRQIELDRAAGVYPACVIANAGATNTGAVDPLDQIADVCAKHNLWLHVDGAYGGLAAATSVGRGVFTGMNRADSIGIDPHKWLYCPYDVGALLVRDMNAVRAAMSFVPEYLSYDIDASEDRRDWHEYKVQLSTRCRALKLWATFKWIGARRLREAIEANVADAHWIGSRIELSNAFELITPVALSVVCFRCAPPELRGDETALNKLNQALVLECERDGRVAITATTLRDRVCLRWCVTNHRTRRADLEAQLEDLESIAHGLTLRRTAKERGNE